MSDCYYDADGCLVCPEQEAQALVPGYVESRPIFGWTAGADSIDAVDGDLHVLFGMPRVVGVVVGLKSARIRVTTPSLIEHGFYFQRRNGLDFVQVIEHGAVRTALAARALTDSFEIRRARGIVSYFINEVAVYTSAEPSAGAKLVNTCLYATGDAAPGAPRAGAEVSGGTETVLSESGTLAAGGFVEYSVEVAPGADSMVAAAFFVSANPSTLYVNHGASTQNGTVYSNKRDLSGSVGAIALAATPGTWYIGFAGSPTGPTDYTLGLGVLKTVEGQVLNTGGTTAEPAALTPNQTVTHIASAGAAGDDTYWTFEVPEGVTEFEAAWLGWNGGISFGRSSIGGISFGSLDGDESLSEAAYPALSPFAGTWVVGLAAPTPGNGSLLIRMLIPSGGTIDDPTLLTDNVAATHIALATAPNYAVDGFTGARVWAVDVPAECASLTADASGFPGGTGVIFVVCHDTLMTPASQDAMFGDVFPGTFPPVPTVTFVNPSAGRWYFFGTASADIQGLSLTATVDHAARADPAITSGVAINDIAIAPSSDGELASDSGWWIDVPAGATALDIVLGGNLTDAIANTLWMIVNNYCRPTWEDGTDDNDAYFWDGLTFDSASNAGTAKINSPTDFAIHIDNPKAGTYSIVLDASAAVSGLTLTATVT